MRITSVSLLLLSIGCSDTPLHPSPPISDATLTVLVVGHLSNGPIATVSVRLEPVDAKTVDGELTKITSSDGRVSWRITAKHQYSVYVRNQRAITSARADGDVQWLISLPE